MVEEVSNEEHGEQPGHVVLLTRSLVVAQSYVIDYVRSITDDCSASCVQAWSGRRADAGTRKAVLLYMSDLALSARTKHLPIGTLCYGQISLA